MIRPFLAWTLGWALLVSAGCGRDDYNSVRNLHSAGQAIVCFGDSWTEGVGAGSGEDYPSVLSRLIGTPIVNAGRRGDTTARAMERLSRDVLGTNPRLVIVLLGGNDFLRQVPLRDTQSNLEAIIRNIHGSGAMVAMAGMKLGLFNDQYNSTMEELADKAGALFVPDVLRGILTDSDLKSDPLHPNGAGYKLIAERIAERIKPLLREADRRRGGGGSG